MSDKPILFSGPMVRALLAGTKTQTRRALSTKPSHKVNLFDGTWADSYVLDPGNQTWREQLCRYAAGDRLYVRETWTHTGTGVWTVADTWHARDGEVIYQADGPIPGAKYWPSIHMPRRYSRLTLAVTDVRVERLQDISEADALAEGVESIEAERFDEFDWSVCPRCGGTRLHGALGPNLGYMEVDCVECDTHKKRYQHLWDHINGPGAWDANPWVAAYSFTVERGNIDQLAARQ